MRLHRNTTNEEQEPAGSSPAGKQEEGMKWECKDEGAGVPPIFFFFCIHILTTPTTGNGQPGQSQTMMQ
jgi:hypothetical protein